MLRVVTLNIHKGLSHFNRRMVIHDLREGLRALQPDLVFLQEVAGLNQRHALRYAAWPVEGAARVPRRRRARSTSTAATACTSTGTTATRCCRAFPIVSHENEDVSDHRFERRGLLHTVVSVPGWKRNLHCLCVHLSLHERGRRRQLDAIAARLEALADKRLPIIVAGDFNDWRQRASSILEKSLGMTEVSVASGGRHSRTFPSMLPLFHLDRIYVRGFRVLRSGVHRGPPWSRLSDHLAVSAELERA